MNTFKWSIGLFACFAIFPAAAKDLYVATTGSDAVSYAANGPSTPWRTIGRAAWGSASRGSPNAAEAARAGDTVYVRAGTYSTPGTGLRYDPSLNPVNNGSAGNPIRFERETAQDRVILQLSSGNGPVIGAYSRGYIEWRGFYINEANAPYAADTGIVTIFSSNNIVIDSNEIIGVPTLIADNHNGIRIEGSNNVRVLNNRIQGIRYSQNIQNWSYTSQNSSGIMLYGNHDVTLEHNEILDSNSGIFPKGADNYNIVIRRNLIYNCIKGIRISYAHRTQGHNYVYQNIIRDGDTRGGVVETVGINIAENAANYTFANNTIDNVQNGVYFQNSINQSNLIFRNNLITNTNNAFNAYEASARAYTLDNQNYFATNEWAHAGVIYYTLERWRTAISGDAASGTDDPRYVDVAIDNLRLNAGPAVNAGVDILDLNTNGNSTDPINLGAYVSANGTEQIGRLNGNSPERPTRVRVQRAQ